MTGNFERKIFLMELNNSLAFIYELIWLILPGFICMSVLYWIKNKNVDDDLIGVLLWSIPITCSIQAICSVIHSFVFSSYDFPEPFKLICYAIIGAIIPFIWYKVSLSRVVEWVLHKTTDKSIHDDIFDNLFDYTKCALVLRIFLKDSDEYYVGQFATKEEKGNDSWIALMDYCLVDKTDNHIIDQPVERNEKSMVMLRISDVEIIELVYEDNSPTWKRFHPWDTNNKQNNTKPDSKWYNVIQPLNKSSD